MPTFGVIRLIGYLGDWAGPGSGKWKWHAQCPRRPYRFGDRPDQAHLDRCDACATVAGGPFYVLGEYAHGVGAVGSNRYEEDQIDFVTDQQL